MMLTATFVGHHSPVVLVKMTRAVVIAANHEQLKRSPTRHVFAASWAAPARLAIPCTITITDFAPAFRSSAIS